ncbi:MAG: hypothetical protein ACI4Q8_02175 [Ruminococcus sp.]
MKDMIKKIVEMDFEAQKLYEQNLSEKDNLEKVIEKEKKEIIDKHLNEAKKIVAEKEAELKKDAQTEWEKNEKSRAEALEKLQKDYEENCDKWVDSIVQRVLS